MEDSQQKTDDPPPLQPERREPGLEDTFEEQSQQSQVSKQMLYQQRQKNELRRLLKHTHPELKMLNDVVDEEFAEVLSLERAAADDMTGYEGEVFSRRLIFESHGSMSPYTSKSHVAEGALGRCDCSKTLTVSDKPKEEAIVPDIIEDDDSLDLRPDFNKQAEEEVIRVDVKATRNIFESQCKPNSDTIQGTVSDERKTVQQPNKFLEIFKDANTDLKEHQQVYGHRTDVSGREDFHGDELPFDDDFTSSDSESQSEIIKTSASLFQNNPFISTNMERENSSGHTSKTPNEAGAAGEDYLAANVKNRTHLFESMPFDKIRHQNRDEVETMMEIIKETLSFLYQVKAIQSAGAIIEVNDTMIAKKAKFTISESGPEIKYDEVAEGGAQNFILQLLPRVNLKPQITYLKEDSKGSMEASVVDVLVHHRQVNPTKNTEFKTANVVQLVEDILNQDNSLRKGVIIQQNVNNCAEVIVYSLYKYLDGEEVKSYSPPKSLNLEFMSNTDDETGTCYTASTIRSPQETTEDQTFPESIKPNGRVNVKFLTSCIEKGDLEYLKTLQDDEPEAQKIDVSQNLTVVGQNDESHHDQRSNLIEEDNSEYVPINVKRLKSLFSEDKSPNSTSISNISVRKGQSSTECNTEPFYHQQPNNTLRKSGGQMAKESAPHDNDRVHQAELAEALNDTDDISDLQTAIQNLHQATKEAKMFCHSLQDPQKICLEESTENLTDTNSDRLSRIMEPLEKTCTEVRLTKNPSVSDVTSGHELVWKHCNAERCHEDNTPEKENMAETRSKTQDLTEIVQNQHIQTHAASENSPEKPSAPEEEEVDFQGKIQAALDSLEKSNINVTRGDFKAAMIYRNSSKVHQRTSQSNETPNAEELCPVAELESTKIPPKQEATGVMQKPTAGVLSQKIIRATGPKPPLPPKPEHLKGKQGYDQTKNPDTTQSGTVRTTKTGPQDPQPSTTENKHLFTSTNELKGRQSNELLGNNAHVSQKVKMKDQVQGSAVAIEQFETDKNIANQQLKISAMGKENPQNTSGKDMNETDENHIDFHKVCQKFGGEKSSSVKTAPVKPKRQKVAHFENKEQQRDLPGGNSGAPPVLSKMDPKPGQMMTNPSCNTCGVSSEMANSKVEMREKKGRAETEDECRQRLSVHMDGIMRGNETAAMEIFDNLQKQEELQRILCRVEQIEQDTSNVDVKSLRRVFESVPDWVVSSDKKKPKRARSENNDMPLQSLADRTESKPSMEHVYGDLARASEEIVNLKEQTLARLKDIEDAIMKALYSVSTLKSDSDIAGLSHLFKESLANVQGPWSSGNADKISASSSKMKLQQSIITKGNTNTQTTQYPNSETSSAKQSPAFVSVQTAASKTELPLEASVCLRCEPSPKLEERFRTTKTLTCNSHAQSGKTDPRKYDGEQSHRPQNRELSVLTLQTDNEGNMGSTIVTGNDERTDEFGNKVYTSRTSTVLNTQPEAATSLNATYPSTCQVSTHP